MNKLLIVLHETIVDCEELLDYIQSPTFGTSYHACISLDGTIVYLVDSDKKAIAAGKSVYTSPTGEKESIRDSVDDFSYQIALETPIDGRDIKQESHSGYTKAQYKSLAWLISRTGVEEERIVTHKQVSLAGSKDPRSFDMGRLKTDLASFKKQKAFDFGMVL